MSTLDIDALMETIRRREIAMNKAKYAAVRQPTYAGPRPDAESELDRPILRWPSERQQAPRRCHHCGAGAANLETQPPYGLVKSGQTVCFVCSRVVVRWRADGTRAGVRA